MSHGKNFGKDQGNIYPRSFVDVKRKKIFSLKPSDMTIMKYEQKFTKLEKYVIFFMLDDEEKYEHFEEGLRTTIRVPVMTSMSDWISSS